jgi:transposase
MAQTTCVLVSTADRERLEAITLDRNRPRKHIERARVVLASIGGGPVQQIAAQVGISRPMVWRWQQRFAEEGVDGLLRDKTRKPGKPPIAAETVTRVVALTCADPPHQATHWTGRAMARAAGISLRSVQRIWEAHQLQPHRLRTFKRSRDPRFADKLVDIVGLYVNPPAHAVVLSIDEKSQIQALDRTQPGLPLKPGRCGTMTHDYKRHGTTTLFAALNVLDGTVIGRCMQRHRHEELIRFLNAVERDVPAGKLIEAVVDNYATHKHPKVKAWLERHPRWTFHFTPTSGSWLNAVENFFSTLTRKRIRRGSFHSILDLQAAINRYLVEHNAAPKPFVWKASAASILAKLDRLSAPSVRVRALDGYLTGQSDWLVNYAERHQAGLRVGTAITEGTANFLVNRRMDNSQQMRWSRRGADLLLQVRCAVYNGTLGSAFGQNFWPAHDPCPPRPIAA